MSQVGITCQRQSFLQELCVWWSHKCTNMGKNSKVRDNEGSSEPLPPKLVKVGSANSSNGSAGNSGSSQATGSAGLPGAQAGQSNDMLTVLTGISTILQKGFDSLKSEVSQVSDGLDRLEDNMSKRFDELEDPQDEEDDQEVAAVPAVPDSPKQPDQLASKKRKRQEDHDLSDGEIVEVQSEVLSEASNALDVDDSVGPPVKDHVAAFVKKAFTKPPKEDGLKRLKDKFPAPSNIDCLDVPRANEPIYIKLSATAKNKDKAIQDNQAIFMRVVCAMVHITDTLAEHEKEGEWIKDIMKVSTDAITLAASLKEDWLKARRDDIKPALPDDFKRLAAVNVPLNSKNLFGDDLEGSIKTVENTNKIAKKMDSGKKKPNQGRYKNKFGYKKKKNFYNNNNNKNKNNNNSNNRNNNKEYEDKKDFRKRGSRN